MNDLFLPPDLSAVEEKRRNLPHWGQDNCTFFVTFRTADSLPQSKLRILHRELESWLRRHPPPWTPTVRRQFRRQRLHRVQKWLDSCYGSCPTRQPQISRIVEESLRHFDAVRYVLDEFVVMPNHVHALVKPLEGFSLAGILHTWKSFSSLQANRALHREGRFWMDESFDHIVRSVEDLERFRRYIRVNPRNAGLKPGEYILGKGTGLVVVTQPAWL